MPDKLTSANFKAEITESTLPVVIKAYAAWCGPCIQMGSVFKEVEKQFVDKAKFLELNVDQARDLAVKFGITSIPTVIFIKDGKIVNKEIGFMDAESLSSAVEQFTSQS